MASRTTSAIPVASRIGGFVYAIRNIVSEAKKVEAAGRKVRYLNIGDPNPFGFEPPAELCRRLRDHTHRWPMWAHWGELARTDDPWGDLLRGSGRARHLG